MLKTAMILVHAGSIWIIFTIIVLSRQSVSDSNLIMTFLAIFIYIFQNVINYKLFITIKKKNDSLQKFAIYKQQAEMYRIQSEEREAMWLESRRLYHDFKQHLICLKGYSEERQYHAMDEYLDAMIGGYATSYWENKSGNTTVDSLIGYKMTKARDLDISLQTDFDISNNLPFEDFDLTIIIGNAFDNAIEAVAKLTAKERSIKLSIKIAQNILTIMLHNPYAGEIRRGLAGNLLSDKEDRTIHGFGLSSIKKTIQKYHGQMKITSDNHFFQLLIIMYGQSNRS